MKLIHLIRMMSQKNATWGAPHITSELALDGHDVGETTVAKSMVKRPHRERKRQSWRAFLRNHMSEAAACDVFTLPSLTSKVHYVFVVFSHDQRRIQHINVTANPTASGPSIRSAWHSPVERNRGFFTVTATASTATPSSGPSGRWESSRSSEPGNRPGRTPSSSA